MPLLRQEVVLGWPCKFYDNGVVKVGTTAAVRFTVRTSAGEHFASLLRAELIKRKLADAEALPVDVAGEAALARNAAAAAQRKAANKAATAAARAEREAALAAAAEDCCCSLPGGREGVRVEIEGLKQQLKLQQALSASIHTNKVLGKRPQPEPDAQSA